MVASIIAYKTVDEAVEATSILEVGLGASIWGNDTAATVEVAKRLQAGTRWVNRHAVLTTMVPMGGVKQSSIGVELAFRVLHNRDNRRLQHSARLSIDASWCDDTELGLRGRSRLDPLRPALLPECLYVAGLGV